LIETDLRGALLGLADLSDADFTEAKLNTLPNLKKDA